MIRIDRGPEPEELPPLRWRALARAVLARRRGDAPVTDGYNVPAVRERLYDELHSKCAYCERQIGKAGQPIEHFRPRRGADRGDPFTGEHLVDEHRYWWLAWSWNNLLLSCATCNATGFKGNWFPLEPGSPQLGIPEGVIPDYHPCFAVGLERRLLIDPAWDDPMDHIAWRPLDPAYPDGPWRAFDRTPCGRVTIRVLGLDGRNVDRAGDHIRHAVKPWIDRIAAALERSSADTHAIWDEALAHLFAPAQPFHAATHDALDFFVPADVRARAGLVLPRPGARPPASPHALAVPAFPARYAGLTDDVVLQLLAAELGTAALIASICQVRPTTVDELANLLQVGAPTVTRHCQELMRDGTLAVDPDGRYASASAPPSPPVTS